MKMTVILLQNITSMRQLDCEMALEKDTKYMTFLGIKQNEHDAVAYSS